MQDDACGPAGPWSFEVGCHSGRYAAVLAQVGVQSRATRQVSAVRAATDLVKVGKRTARQCALVPYMVNAQPKR